MPISVSGPSRRVYKSVRSLLPLAFLFTLEVRANCTILLEDLYVRHEGTFWDTRLGPFGPVLFIIIIIILTFRPYWSHMSQCLEIWDTWVLTRDLFPSALVLGSRDRSLRDKGGIKGRSSGASTEEKRKDRRLEGATRKETCSFGQC